MAKRTSTATPFAAGTALGFVNTAAYEKWLDVCPSGYYIVSRDNGATGQDLFEGHFGSATTGTVANVNSAASEISTRTSETTPFTVPVPVTEFGTSADDEDLFISKNGRIAVFASTRGTTNSKDIFSATR